MIQFPSSERLVELWVAAYRESPRVTGLVSLLVLAAVATGVYFGDKHDRQAREAERLQSLDYATQVQQLQQTETSLHQLITFVAHQKNTLRQTQDTLHNLKLEQERLRPLLESDRSTVDAILSVQDRRNSANLWRERWIGFGLGVVSSLLASFIWAVSARLRRRPKVAV